MSPLQSPVSQRRLPCSRAGNPAVACSRSSPSPPTLEAKAHAPLQPGEPGIGTGREDVVKIVNALHGESGRYIELHAGSDVETAVRAAP